MERGPNKKEFNEKGRYRFWKSYACKNSREYNKRNNIGGEGKLSPVFLGFVESLSGGGEVGVIADPG